MSDKKRILIVYATAGIGHKKAAMAVFEELKHRNSDVDAKIVDVLHYSSFIFRKTYAQIYVFLIRRFSFLWGFFYHSLNIRLVHSILAPARRAIHVLNSRGFARLLLEYRPHVVISTHFVAPDVCNYVKKKSGLKMQVINVITDFRAHSFWISPGVDIYAVGHERVKEELVAKWKIPATRVRVTGIPIEGKFLRGDSAGAIRKKMNISPDVFVTLLLSGGNGVGPMLEILKALEKASFPLVAIAVCGHNNGLFLEIERFRKQASIQIINMAFVDNVDELMSCADVYIGKAGGISSSEGLAKELPCIFVNPIPGQERANADHLTGVGACLEIRDVSQILGIVSALRSSDDKMAVLKKNIKETRRPGAASEIADIAEKL